jgi:two-component system nitrate/nitrite response regulator NarL
MTDERRLVVHTSQRFVLDGLCWVCKREPMLDLVGATTASGDLAELCERERPHVVLVDVDSVGDPIDLARVLLRLDKLVRLVALRRSSVAPNSIALRRAGYRATVHHDDGLVALLDALRVDSVAPVSNLSMRVLADAGPSLTAREHDVLMLIANGCSTQETSGRLGISAKTVENHKQRMFRKLDVQSQAHAVSVAMRHGLLRQALAQEA